jgi:DNA-binding MarR family transcriptional regulator
MTRPPDDKPTPGASALAADLRALVSQFKRRLREQADIGELTPSQTSALVRLERDGPLTLSALARAEGVRPQSMATTVAALQAAGHVGTARDPSDGRQTILSLTPACRDWIAAGRAARQDWLARRIARDLNPAEQQLLAEAVAMLKRIADP